MLVYVRYMRNFHLPCAYRPRCAGRLILVYRYILCLPVVTRYQVHTFKSTYPYRYLVPGTRVVEEATILTSKAAVLVPYQIPGTRYQVPGTRYQGVSLFSLRSCPTMYLRSY